MRIRYGGEFAVYGRFHVEPLGNIEHELASFPVSVKGNSDFYANEVEVKFFVENVIVRIVCLSLGHPLRPMVFLWIVREPFANLSLAFAVHVS